MLRLGVVCIAATLAFAPQAAAVGKLKAKFKVVSASGRQTLSFHEESSYLGSDGETKRCVGTTTAEASWRTTPPKTVYVFVSGSGKRARITLSDDRVGQGFEAAHPRGKATVSRTVDYQETAGCHDPPTACPKATGRATMYLVGTRERLGNVYGGIDKVRLPEGPDLSCTVGSIFPGFTEPFGDAGPLFPRVKGEARVLARSRILDPHRKRVKDSDTFEQPFSASDPEHGATLSGTYTDHLKISLKRLKLKR
jgi:hypothetical protein